MLRIYGSEMCPDCIACKANFDVYGVGYDYIDINASLQNLKAFLQLRDSDPVFNQCRKNNTIGLPALINEDGTVFLNWEKYLEEKGHEVLDLSAAKACSLSRKGC